MLSNQCIIKNTLVPFEIENYPLHWGVFRYEIVQDFRFTVKQTGNTYTVKPHFSEFQY